MIINDQRRTLVKARAQKFHGTSRRPKGGETPQQLIERLTGYAAMTRARATRSVSAVVPNNVVVLAGPRRRVAA